MPPRPYAERPGLPTPPAGRGALAGRARDQGTGMSRVDVVIPCYKYAHFLRACVQSVLRQDGVDVRVLVIDDCSPDHTPEVARELCSEDERVAFRRHPVNRGHIETYNEGLLEWAGGDYVLLLSADDMLTPGALRRAANVMDDHPGVGFVHGRDIKTAHPGEPTDRSPVTPRADVIDGREVIRRMCEEGTNAVSTPTAIVRTSLQRRVGGYRTQLPHSGDMEMWLRLAAHAGVGYVHAPQAYYRLHPGNMSRGYAVATDLRARRAAFDTFFAGQGQRLADAQALCASAYRALSEDAFWQASHLFDRGDADACDGLLDLAAEFEPAIRTSPPWRRLRLKRMAGGYAWRLLRPGLRALRSRTGSCGGVAAAAGESR